MNGKLVAGISFQIIQFLILGIIGLFYLLENLSITKEVYVIIFGGIILAGLNVLSITFIISGKNE